MELLCLTPWEPGFFSLVQTHLAAWALSRNKECISCKGGLLKGEWEGLKVPGSGDIVASKTIKHTVLLGGGVCVTLELQSEPPVQKQLLFCFRLRDLSPKEEGRGGVLFHGLDMLSSFLLPRGSQRTL